VTDVGSNEGDGFTPGVDALGGVSRSPGSTYRNLGFSMSLYARRRLTGSRYIAFDCGRIFHGAKGADRATVLLRLHRVSVWGSNYGLLKSRSYGKPRSSPSTTFSSRFKEYLASEKHRPISQFWPRRISSRAVESLLPISRPTLFSLHASRLQS